MITVAALNHRLETGVGQYVDFSMAEALSASLPEALLDYQMNGNEPVPLGNRDRNSAPHGVYRCAGDDRWIAVEVHTSEQWRGLCEAMGRSDLAADAGLDTAEGRKAREDELDRAIGAWTAEIEDGEAFRILQEAGVQCGLSLDMGRLHAERQLNEGGYLRPIEYPDGSEHVLPTLPWRFDGRTDLQLGPAPGVGAGQRVCVLGVAGVERRGDRGAGGGAGYLLGRLIRLFDGADFVFDLAEHDVFFGGEVEAALEV